MSDEELKAHPEAKDGELNLMDESVNKVDEYFKIKGIIRTLRTDIKDAKAQIPEVQELEKVMKKVADLRAIIKDNEQVRDLTERLETQKERMDLLKELIRIELLEKAQEEVIHDDRRLRILSILRELKAERKGKSQKPHPDQINIFHPQATP